MENTRVARATTQPCRPPPGWGFVRKYKNPRDAGSSASTEPTYHGTITAHRTRNPRKVDHSRRGKQWNPQDADSSAIAV